MTEFTKEELETMLNWGDVYCEFGASWMYKAHKPLMDKLQSMIENYCEHPVLEGCVIGFKCMGCNRMFYDNQ